MATVSDKSRQTYADADEFIQYQIDEARSRIKSTDLLTAIVLTGLLLVSYILVFTIFDHWVIDGGFSAWTRAGMLLVVLSICGAIIFRYVLRPWFQHIHPLYAARMLDKTSEGLEGSLLTLVDLQAGGRKSDESIQRTLEKRAAVRLADVHVDEAIDRRLLVKLTGAMFVVTAITCLYAVFSPKSISLLRPLSVANANVATRTVIDAVKPGSGKVPGGSHLDIIADISGVIPEHVQVLYSTEDRRFVDEPLTMRTTDDPHRFQATMIGEGDRGLRQNFNYRIVAGDATSDTFAIVVEQPPTAQVVEVRYEYPDYMLLPDRTDASGTIEAWEGSTVTILAESNVPIQTALLQLSDEAAFKAKGEEVRMEIRDRTLTAKLTLDAREDGTVPKFYRIQVYDADGHSDPDPVAYALEIRRDQAPVVKLHDPSRDLQVPANAIIPLLVEAEDPDFVLRSVTLHYSVNGRQIQPAEILLDTTRSVMPKRWMNTHEFRLEPLNLKAGDVVTYHIQARDNRPPLGNQGRTADLNLQILGAVSDAEAKEQLELDREIQEQQRKNLEGNPTDPDPSGNESSERELPENGNESPMPDKDANPLDNANDPQNEAPGSNENSDAPGTDGPQSKASNSQPPNAQDPSSKPNESGETRPGTESTAEPPKRKLDDDEALQKLIEEMNRRREQNGDSDRSDATSGEQSKAADPTAGNSKASPGANDGKKSSDAQDDMKSNGADSSRPENDASEKQNPSGETENNGKTTDEPNEETSGKAGERNTPSDEGAGDKGKSEPNPQTTDPANPSENSTEASGEKSASKPTDPKSVSPEDDSKRPNEQQGTAERKSAPPSEMNDDPDRKSPQDNADAQGTKQERSEANNEVPESSGTKNSEKKNDGSADSKTEPGKDNPQNDKGQSSDAARDQQSKTAKPNDKKGAEDSPTGENEKSPTGEDQKSGDKQSSAREQANKENKSGEKSGQKNADQMNDEKSSQKEGAQSSNSEGGKSGDKGNKSSRSNDQSGKQNGEKAASDDMKSNNSDSAQQQSSDKSSNDNSSKNGNDGDSKSGNSQPGDSKSGSKSGDSKSADSKAGNSGSKSGDSKSSDTPSGDGKSDNGKSASNQAGNKEPNSKSGNTKSADAKSSENQSGEGKSGEGKSGDGKSGEGKSGDGKSGEGKSGEGKSGEGESGKAKEQGSKQDDAKSSEGKSGDNKSAGQQSENGKSGDSKSSGNKSGGKDSGGGKSDGKVGAGKSSSSSKGGQNSSGSGKSGPSQQSNVPSASGPAELGGGNAPSGDQQAEGMEGEKGREGGAGMTSESPPVTSDPDVDEAAEAASLALKRLEKDLDRGTVDQKLLDELGWTAEELAAFKERLQKQLEERKLNEQQEKERSLSQKSFDEMLRSLDVKSAGKAREGRTDRDRDQQDTTNRQQVVPRRYQQWYEMYQRSISEGTKSTKDSQGPTNR